MSLVDIAKVRVEERYALDMLADELESLEDVGYNVPSVAEIEEAFITKEISNLRKCSNCKYIDTFDCGLSWKADGDCEPLPKPDGYPNEWYCADFEIKEKL